MTDRVAEIEQRCEQLSHAIAMSQDGGEIRHLQARLDEAWKRLEAARGLESQSRG